MVVEPYRDNLDVWISLVPIVYVWSVPNDIVFFILYMHGHLYRLNIFVFDDFVIQVLWNSFRSVVISAHET